MSATSFLLKRYLFPKQSKLLNLALWITVLGIIIGIVEILVVLAVMAGFQNMLQDHYVRISSDIVVLPQLEMPKKEDFRKHFENLDFVEAISPFQLGQGMLIKNGASGIVFEGIEYNSSRKITPWEKIWRNSPIKTEKNLPGIWIGDQLAKKMSLKPGDKVDILFATAKGMRTLPMMITAITKFGIYDHDLRYARIDLNVLEKIAGTMAYEPLYKVKLKEKTNLDVAAKEISKNVKPYAKVKKWSQINSNIFLAVEHQKKTLFLILEILVILAGVNVINLLLMNAYQRRKDIAILRAMGFRKKQVFYFFLAQGSFVGLVGIVLGLVSGWGICRLVERFQPAVLNEMIYNTTTLPFKIEWSDTLIIASVSFAICVLLSIVPAVRASRMAVMVALRND